MLPRHNKALDPLVVPRVVPWALVALGGSGSAPPSGATPRRFRFRFARLGRCPRATGKQGGGRMGPMTLGLRGSALPLVPCTLTGHQPSLKVAVVPCFAFASPRRAGGCPSWAGAWGRGGGVMGHRRGRTWGSVVWAAGPGQ